jgi:hypothetical protein
MDQNARPGFYEGRYLGAEDLSAVVDYARIQQARHTLGAHTWGIGAGLELRERPLASGEVEMSVLPGIAWDGYGRAVVVLAPARVGPEKFANFLADTPPEGLLIKVWLRYHEMASRGSGPGFGLPDGQYSRSSKHSRSLSAVDRANTRCHCRRPLGRPRKASRPSCGAPDRRRIGGVSGDTSGGTRPFW